MKRNEIWQHKNVLSEDWSTDDIAMNNPIFKSFADYQKHIKQMNKKFKSLPAVKCRSLPIPNTTK